MISFEVEQPTHIHTCMLTIHTKTKHVSSPALYIAFEELPSGEATLSCKKH